MLGWWEAKENKNKRKSSWQQNIEQSHSNTTQNIYLFIYFFSFLFFFLKKDYEGKWVHHYNLKLGMDLENSTLA